MRNRSCYKANYPLFIVHYPLSIIRFYIYGRDGKTGKGNLAFFFALCYVLSMISENAKGWQTLDNNLQVHYSGQGYMQVMDKFRKGVLAEKQDQPAPSTPKKQEWQTGFSAAKYICLFR